MKTLLSCAYNMDNCCVELKFANGSMIAIGQLQLRMKMLTICISDQNWII